MKEILTQLALIALTAVKNATRHPKTSIPGIVGITTGVILLKNNGDLTTAITSIIGGAGLLLADDPNSTTEIK